MKASICLPSTLYVENWPLTGMAQYEWYVPTDKGQHEYWQVLVKNCPTQKDRDDFTLRYNNVWEELALKSGFNDDDIFAREEMEDFYNNRNGWEDEQFFPWIN